MENLTWYIMETKKCKKKEWKTWKQKKKKEIGAKVRRNVYRERKEKIKKEQIKEGSKKQRYVDVQEE